MSECSSTKEAFNDYIRLESLCLHRFLGKMEGEENHVIRCHNFVQTSRTSEELAKYVTRSHGWNNSYAILDYTLRTLSSYGWNAGTTRADRNPIEAADRTLKLLNDYLFIDPLDRTAEFRSQGEKPPALVLAQARSVAAYAYYMKYKATPHERTEGGVLSGATAAFPDLLAAANYAFLATQAGFVSGAVVAVAHAFRTFAEWAELDTLRYRRYEGLRCASISLETLEREQLRATGSTGTGGSSADGRDLGRFIMESLPPSFKIGNRALFRKMCQRDLEDEEERWMDADALELCVDEFLGEHELQKEFCLFCLPGKRYLKRAVI